MAYGRVGHVPRLAVFASLLVLALCIASAVYIYWEQAVERHSVKVTSANRAVLVNLQNALKGVSNSLASGKNSEVLDKHERIKALLAQAQELPSTPEEREVANELQSSFDRYRLEWERRRATAKSLGQILAADLVMDLETDIIPRCRAWRDLDFAMMEQAADAHSRSMQLMAWGLGAVGVVGSFAALLLGFNAVRVFRRSLQQLSVSVRIATEKLGQTLPIVTINEHGDLDQVQEQMQGLTGEIEKVVERLNQREREALRAKQMAAVGQVAAGVAHELRNPLTSIRLLVHANRREAEIHGLQVDDYAVVEQEIRRMDRCLQTFLDFARPPQTVRRPLDLVEVVERAMALIGGRAQKQNVTVHFTHDQAPCFAEADAEQVVQVLVNLALNALDVMPRGGQLQVDVFASKEGQAIVRVLDTGPGISPQIAPRLFEPFASGKETGLGLGLAISRRIAESHGGSLLAENRPQGGACFELRLPALAAKPLTTAQTFAAT